jgi:hypothetical protein
LTCALLSDIIIVTNIIKIRRVSRWHPRLFRSQTLAVVSATGDVETKTVTVEWESPATWDGIKSLLDEINYPAAE